MTSLNWVDTIRNGGNVKRYHTFMMLKEQDVAQHSFNCALLAHHYAEYVADVDAYKVVMHMLLHDVPETGIGDTPYGTKLDNPELKKALDEAEDKWCEHNVPARSAYYMYPENFTNAEIAFCRYIDMLEAYFKIREELLMGNKRFQKLRSDMIRACIGHIHKNNVLTNLTDDLLEIDDQLDEELGNAY